MHTPTAPRLLASLAVLAIFACRSSKEADPASEIRRSERVAAERDAARVCERPVAVYEGSISVASTDYLHPVARGDDFVDEPVGGLDRVVAEAARVRFTLDYPFDKPFAGVVTGPITLRRTIDAIRAGLRTMYAGTTQQDVPGMANKDVRGPYGRAFHVIEDLVIERIELCADASFAIFIGS